MQAFYRNGLYIFYIISVIDAKIDTWLKGFFFFKVSVVPSSYYNFIYENCANA